VSAREGELGQSPDGQLLTVVEYVKRAGGDLDARLIAEIKNVALTAKRASVRHRAAQYLIDHWDPVPRPPVLEITTGPVSIGWTPDPSSSPTRLAPTNGSSTTPSGPIALGPASSSATDALESL
jgi:hypothetical protein